MADNDTFDVVVTGFEPARESPAERLQRVFGVDTAVAEKLLTRLPAPVQRRVPRVRAEYFRRALLKIGAGVEVRDANGAVCEPIAAPDSTPPPRPRSSRPPEREQDAHAAAAPAGMVFTDAAFGLGDEGAAWSPADATAASALAAPTTFDAAPSLGAAAMGTARLDHPSGGTADTLIDRRPRPEPSSPAAVAPVIAEPQPDWPVLASNPDPTLVDPMGPKLMAGDQALHGPAHPTWLEGKPIAPSTGGAARAAQPASAQGPVAGLGRANATTIDAPLREAAVAQLAPKHAAAARPQPGQAAYSLGDLDLPAKGTAPALDQRAAAQLPATGEAFRPPPLELGGSGDDISVLSRLPSSVWDAAPPPKGAPDEWLGDLPLPLPIDVGHGPPLDGETRAGAPRRAPRELSQPNAHNDPLTLDDSERNAGGKLLSKWESDDGMSDPPPPSERRSVRAVRAAAVRDSKPAPTSNRAPIPSYAPAARLSPAPAPLELPSAAPVRPSPQRAAGERSKRARKPGAAAAARDKATKAAAAAKVDSRSFWQALPDAFALPWSGHGVRWVAVITVWAIAAAALSFAALAVPPLGVAVAFVAYGSLLALACDYFRACFWIAPVGTKTLERAPVLDAERVLHAYVKGGMHLSLIALTIGLPLIIWMIQALGQGSTPIELMREPALWCLGLLPGALWPALITVTALRNNLSAVWNVPEALAGVRRAPREYLTVVAIGELIFGGGVWMMLASSDALGLSGVLLTLSFGVPLAISHGVMGALMGHLMRARPEVFG